MLEDHKFIIFALEHYNPLGMIRSLGCMGINPIYISVKRRYEVAIKSKYISKLHKVDSIQEGYDLLMREYGNEQIKPYLMFSDDKSVGFFDQHYDEWKDKFIGYNAGQADRINYFINKYEIQQCANRHGLTVLDSFIVNKNEPLPQYLWYPVITKDISPNVGNWKADVYICQNEEELRGAMERIAIDDIMVQHFIDKENEMTLEGYAINHGSDVHIVSQCTYKYLIPGYYSPYVDVQMFKYPDLEAKLASMFKEIGFEGVFEAEFIIDKDGTFYFTEINFRASAWNYVGVVAGMPLPYLWCKGMENGYIDPADRKQYKPFVAMSEVIDYAKRVEGGMISEPEWWRYFKEAECTFIYNKDDIAPFEEVYKNFDAFK